jgi:hypothetical protein
MYREIIAVCSEIHTKHINTQCGQNVELLNVKLVVHKVSLRLRKVKIQSYCHLYQAFSNGEFLFFVSDCDVFVPVFRNSV